MQGSAPVERQIRDPGSGVSRESEAAHDEAAFKPNTPLVLSVVWLGGTYLAFLLTGQVDEVPDMLQLNMFIGATLLALVIGYRAESRRTHVTVPLEVDTRKVRRVTLWSGLYLASYGVALLASFGVTGPAAIMKALLHPGEAYASKFAFYAAQSTAPPNRAIQVLTLLAVLYVPLVPFTILFWKRLTIPVRIFALVAVGIYASFYLYIGTLKGLGDLLIFASVGAIVRHAQKADQRERRISTRRLAVLGIVAAVAFGGYMAFNQSQRLVVFSNESSFVPNPVIEAVAGEEFARGASVVVSYPTHGYLGLAKNLGTPFVWTYGLGSSRALDSYVAQYGLAKSVADITYPARTEQRTGWSQDSSWATAYPWFASDLTFPGVVLMMGILGWWLSKLWREAVQGRSQLALLLLADLMLFVMFIPANNQIGLSRPASIGFMTLVLIYAVKHRSLGFSPLRQPNS